MIWCLPWSQYSVRFVLFSMVSERPKYLSGRAESFMRARNPGKMRSLLACNPSAASRCTAPSSANNSSRFPSRRDFLPVVEDLHVLRIIDRRWGLEWGINQGSHCQIIPEHFTRAVRQQCWRTSLQPWIMCRFTGRQRNISLQNRSIHGKGLLIALRWPTWNWKWGG